MYAETGDDFQIKLTRSNIERVATNPENSQFYLGVLRTSTKIMWGWVPPKVDFKL